MKISKREFESPLFRKMLRGKDPSTPVLNQEQLKRFVNAEFEVMTRFMAFIIKEKMEEARDNRFAQVSQFYSLQRLSVYVACNACPSVSSKSPLSPVCLSVLKVPCLLSVCQF